jgi:hypothetical protein
MLVKSKITIVRRAVKRYIVLPEFLIALGILPGHVWSVPTVSVSPCVHSRGMSLQGIASAPLHSTLIRV